MLELFIDTYENCLQYCKDNFMLVLAVGEAIAILLAIIALIRTKRKDDSTEPEPNEKQTSDEKMYVNVAIDMADVKICCQGQELELIKKQEASPVESAEKEKLSVTEVKDNAEPIIDEKRIAFEKSHKFNTSRSGRVFSEEELEMQIRK